MNVPLTVLIPVLNGMPYLPEMLASLEAQTCQDFTVILCDNGSTDSTLDEAFKWIPSRIKGRVIAGEGLALHECLAKMVELSETEFCARMDADDLSHPTRFAHQLREFKSDSSLLVLGSQADYIDADGNASGGTSNFPLEYSDILAGMLVENQLLHPTVMFRRQAILNAGNYAFNKPCEDYDLWMKVAALGVIRNLPDRLLSYRQHPNSILATARNMEQLEEPNLRCLENHSEELFGIFPFDYRKLRKKEYFFSIIPLLMASCRISHLARVSQLRVLKSRYFQWSARSLTASGDLFSRMIWGLFQRI